MVESNSVEYEKLQSMPVVDYLVKCDKFTAEMELNLRHLNRIKSKSNGRR
jgi:hypothetical protein